MNNKKCSSHPYLSGNNKYFENPVPGTRDEGHLGISFISHITEYLAL